MPCRRILLAILTCAITITVAAGCLPNVQLQQNPLTAPTPESYREGYEAPLRGCDDNPEYNDPQTYSVILIEGYTLIDHSDAIGFPIEPYISILFDIMEPGIGYIARRITDEMLAKIWADLGVERVRCVKRIIKEPCGVIPPERCFGYGRRRRLDEEGKLVS